MSWSGREGEWGKDPGRGDTVTRGGKSAWGQGRMGAWEKTRCHSGRDPGAIRNPEAGKRGSENGMGAWALGRKPGTWNAEHQLKAGVIARSHASCVTTWQSRAKTERRTQNTEEDQKLANHSTAIYGPYHRVSQGKMKSGEKRFRSMGVRVFGGKSFACHGEADL